MINLDRESKLCALFGYKIDELKKDEGEQDVPILTKTGIHDGMLHITQLPNKMYMNQVVIEGSHDDIDCNNWITDYMRLYCHAKYRGYKICVNLFDFPDYRLCVEKDDEFIGFGLFDFTGGGSKKSKEERKEEKSFCSLADCGFYIQYRLGTQKEELLFSNMKKDANHLTTAYSHLSQGKGINVTCKDYREDAETIARNDLYGMEFFERIKKKLSEIFPEAGDVLSLFISDEEIEKYGLSIYFEQKKQKNMKKKKKNQNI